MIGKVVTGKDVRGLLRYLYGPGRANEHTDPHLAGAWTPPPRVEPPVDERGHRDLSRLVALLEAPLIAAPRVAEAPVWHCALRAAPGDRRLTDTEWDDVAREVLHTTGLAPRDQAGGCRWVAVRHAEDHVHLLVTLARHDGRAVSTFRDFYRVGEACRAVEARYGLTPTAPRDRTATRAPTRAETEKATRAGRKEPARVTLAKEARYAAAASASAREFFDRLRDAGVLLRPRYSEHTPGQVTGYAVALPGDHTAGGAPVWFGGGKLAPDLSWPRLSTRWAPSPDTNTPAIAATPMSTYGDAATVVRDATTEVRRVGRADPGQAADIAAGISDVLTVTARAVEGRQGGPLTVAAGHFDRATREPFGHTARSTTWGRALREAAWALTRAARPPATRGSLAELLHATAGLVETLAELRAMQQREAQPKAALQAMSLLTASANAATTDWRPDSASVRVTAARRASTAPPRPARSSPTRGR